MDTLASGGMVLECGDEAPFYGLFSKPQPQHGNIFFLPLQFHFSWYLSPCNAFVDKSVSPTRLRASERLFCVLFSWESLGAGPEMNSVSACGMNACQTNK